MLVLKIAFRNIFRQKRRSLYTALSIIIGFTLLSISIGLAEGGYGHLIEMFTRGYTGHIQIHQKDYLERPGLYKNFQYDDDLVQSLNSIEGIKSYTPRIHSGSLAFIDKKTTGIQLIGINPVLEQKTTIISAKLGKGQFISETNSESPHNEMIIGNGIAEILKAKIGSQIVLIGQGADGSIANDIFKVVGIMKKENDSTERTKCYIHLYKAQEFLAMYGKVHEVAIVLNSYKDARETSEKLQTVLNNDKLEVAPWQRVEELFYKSMQADKAGNKVMIIIIVLVVGLGVLNTVLMSILERTREFGVMKAMGTTPLKIGLIIVTETVILSIIAATLSIFTSLLANWPLVKYGIKYDQPLSVGGIYFEAIYSDWVYEAFVTPYVVVVLTAIIVSVFPAIKAMLVKPVDAIRTY